jgi:8-oxo-dGTP diphosphatase
VTADEERFARPRVAAGVLYRDDGGRVLLVKPTYKDGWEIPGGYVQEGESPRAAAIRELAEELGVAWPVGKLLAVDWAPHPAEGDKLLFVFDGGVLRDSELERMSIDRDELAEAAMHDTELLAERMPARLAQRVKAALSGEGNSYLEHGQATANAT